MEYEVLVDIQHKETGTMEKLQAHVEGKLHRAISVFIFNTRGEMLLQQRAAGKYHSSLLWTNACCSHPRPAESVADAAHRRLHEEMGISSPLHEIFSFTYKAHLENDLTEYEFDHVFKGITDEEPRPDASEVAAFRYVDMETLRHDIAANPGIYTEWFKICIKEHIVKLKPYN